MVALACRDHDAATLYCEKSLALRQLIGDQQGVAHSFFLLGQLAYQKGNDANARSLYQESLGIQQNLNDIRLNTRTLYAYSLLAFRRAEKVARAGRLLGAATTLYQSLDASIAPKDIAEYNQHIATIRSRIGEADFMNAWDGGQAMTLEQAIEYALQTSESPIKGIDRPAMDARFL